MTPTKKLIYEAYRGTDLSSLLLSLLLIGWYQSNVLNDLLLADFFFMRLSLVNFLGLIACSLVYLLVFERTGLYKPKFLPRHHIADGYAIAKACGLNSLLLVAAGALFNVSLFEPIVTLLVFFPLCTVLTIILRAFVWHSLKLLHVGDKNSRGVLVVGSNSHAVEYASMIELMGDVGCRFLGYVDDEVIDDRAGSRRLGGFSSFEDLLDKHVVDEVVICMPVSECFAQVQHIITRAHRQGILVRFPLVQLFKELFGEADYLRLECSQAVISPSGATAPELTINSGFKVSWHFLVKRVFDLISAPMILLVVSPVLLVSAGLIMRTPGPVFFRQERYGYNGRVFKIFKFRTMVDDADSMQDALRSQHNELDGAAFKMKNDPRVTKVGQFLRKTSIDELPQLLNVIKGEMSLVGPRPLPLADYDQFTEISHLRRLSVLPGITCHWQASGRNNIPFEEWMRLDMEYVDNSSLWSDIKILLKTIPAVLKGSGAS